MPAKNSIKNYAANGYYHLYNRGVEKRIIFEDVLDYAVFCSYLKEYLTSKNKAELQSRLSDSLISYKEKYEIIRLINLNNFYAEIELLAYCLMPNHFHFLVKQNSANSIDCFMNSLGTRYTMYFNKRHKRIGTLYQGVYKAVKIESDEQLLHLTRYIHRNPVRLGSKGEAFCAQINRQPSSYPEYLGQRKTSWVKHEEILNFFSKTNPLLTYQTFVEQMEDLDIIKKVAIDIDI